jgi:hypothetical protein
LPEGFFGISNLVPDELPHIALLGLDRLDLGEQELVRVAQTLDMRDMVARQGRVAEEVIPRSGRRVGQEAIVVESGLW